MNNMINMVEVIENIVMDNYLLGIIVSMIVIFIESIIPIIPSGTFIALIFILFGNCIGFTICYIFTLLGCISSYFIFNKFNKRIKNKKIIKIVKNIDNMSLSKLTTILSFPFTPAFPINIACGIANYNFKKFLIAIVISKIFAVYFWGFVGNSLIESFKNPVAIIKIFIILILSFIISKMISKKFDLD